MTFFKNNCKNAWKSQNFLVDLLYNKNDKQLKTKTKWQIKTKNG